MSAPWPFGPIAEAWRLARLDRAFSEPVVVEPSAVVLTAAPTLDDLARKAVEVATSEIGRGEEGGDNCGPSVERYCGCSGVNWCAGFAGYCYQMAAESLGMPLPFKRSLGAKRLGKNVGEVGRTFTDPRFARAGDLIVWHRGAEGSWSGHVGLVERVGDVHTVTTIEGNSGVNVRRRIHDLSRERLAFFASVRL